MTIATAYLVTIIAYLIWDNFLAAEKWFLIENEEKDPTINSARKVNSAKIFRQHVLEYLQLSLVICIYCTFAFQLKTVLYISISCTFPNCFSLVVTVIFKAYTSQLIKSGCIAKCCSIAGHMMLLLWAVIWKVFC